MNSIRIIASVIAILYGLMTFVGYYLVILPSKEPIELLEVALSFSFAGLGILGGILAIFNKRTAAIALILSCALYAVSALYQPIQYAGLSAFGLLHQDTYIGFSIRCLLATVIIVILFKNSGGVKNVT